MNQIISFANLTQENSFESINDERKMRLSLSAFCISVIESDKLTYGYKNNSSFCNAVFTNMCRYYEYSEEEDCVFAFGTYRKAKSKLLEITKDIKIINNELKNLENSLSAKINRLINSDAKESIMIVLSGENSDYLANESKEANAYGKYGSAKFFKCVIESYARKTFIERERIMTYQTVETMKNAIELGNVLKIYTGKNSRQQQDVFYVKPYKIYENPLTTFTYLVGLSSKVGEENFIPASFRISRIDKIVQTKKKSFLSKEKEKEIEKTIKERGVMYLLSEAKPVEVLLTKNGINMYNVVLSSRPTADGSPESLPDGRIKLNFFCTLKQITDYFFAFGKEVEIASPVELREVFKERYKNALELYL